MSFLIMHNDHTKLRGIPKKLCAESYMCDLFALSDSGSKKFHVVISFSGLLFDYQKHHALPFKATKIRSYHRWNKFLNAML